VIETCKYHHMFCCAGCARTIGGKPINNPKCSASTIPRAATEHEAPQTSEARRAIAENTYETMCTLLYAYRFGTIGSLELLDKFEEILQIEPPLANRHNAPNKKE
jgi:hypothetical protein